MLSEFAPRREQPIEVRAEWDEQEHVFRVAARFGRRARRFLAQQPDATIVAGATDIGVRINKSLTHPAKDSRPESRRRVGGRGDRERRTGARRAGQLDGDRRGVRRAGAGVLQDRRRIRSPADSARRHDRRQHRQRLADCRFAAVSVRHGRGAGTSQRGRHPPA